MTQDTHIPPEAVEAAARKIALGTEGSDEWWTLYMRRATAAIRAALAAWPGMTTRTGLHIDLILPLNTEPRDE